ncbi:enoyl-CoA hydratase-related protein [Alicyclobacillus shizuokensis]|uniref:enoyl-CoA hydratase-related protein n=1 Tax=Alicyclobacillus shizuokensis TaxID=392014 RepID=UPI00082F1407|nr:enoyl-CoA hydratase-related protein [Alicyclobacillus shizuokensis]MCL6626042.1 enoyl-CoA hydratase/isomerase family protein [Alicyclobacillus shizuokensis]
MYETIRYQVEDGVALVTLNRPQVMNAVNQQMGKELYDAFKRVDADASVRALVLTGEGRGFCSGQDLSEGQSVEPGASLGDTVRERYNLLIARLHGLSVPTIAAVSGAAAGAGFSLALACDLRFAAVNAKFTLAFNKIGLVPDSGASYFLPRLVGVGKALELAWTGDVLSAETARALGIVNHVYEPDQLLQETLAFARQLAQGPTFAYRLTKQALFANATASLADALEVEAQLQDAAGRSEDFREGVSAFLEKRRPQYRGR